MPVVPNLASACESRLVGAGGKQRSTCKFAEKKTCGFFRDLIVERPARVEPDIKSRPAKDGGGGGGGAPLVARSAAKTGVPINPATAITQVASFFMEVPRDNVD